MPFVIAAFVYGLFAAPILAYVLIAGRARGRQVGLAVFTGTIGSMGGFLFGCAAAVLVFVSLPEVGKYVGATLVVIPVSLVCALLGATVGVVAARTSARMSSQSKLNQSDSAGSMIDHGV
ncbi:hypothetical protein BH10PLA2_BH10PLA2_27860 [soil metagenome]